MNPNKKSTFIFLFLFACCIKLSSVFYFVNIGSCLPGSDANMKGALAYAGGDAPGYMDPIDNYINEGNYYIRHGNYKAEIGRGPFYGIPYYFLRQVFDQVSAYNAYVIIQILIECLAILLFSLLVRLIVQKDRAFWWSYVFLLLSYYATTYSNYLAPESLHISFLGIFAYVYFLFQKTGKKNLFILSAILFSFIVLLKPYFAPFYLVIGFDFIKRFGFVSAIKKSLLFVVPLLLCSAPWTIRNYVKSNRFIPFAELYGDYGESESYKSVAAFISSWGGSNVFWDKRSAACYFVPNPPNGCEFNFPSYAFTKGYSRKDVDEARDLYVQYQLTKDTSLGKQVITKFNTLTSLYKTERPFFYHFISPLIIAKSFLFHSGSYYLPISKTSSCYKGYQLVIKLLQSGLYYLMLIGGFAGLIFLGRKNNLLVFTLIPFYLIVFFCFGLRSIEFRYFDSAYYPLVLGLIFLLLEKFKLDNFFRKSHTSRNN